MESSPQKILWEYPEAALLDLGVSEAALLDLGDGVALYEFRSPGNVLNAQVIEGLFNYLRGFGGAISPAPYPKDRSRDTWREGG